MQSRTMQRGPRLVNEVLRLGAVSWFPNGRLTWASSDERSRRSIAWTRLGLAEAWRTHIFLESFRAKISVFCSEQGFIEIPYW